MGAKEGSFMEESILPYIIFLSHDKKRKILRAIFGSPVPVNILNFSIRQGISKRIYQQTLIKNLEYSNKTVIEYLKELTDLGILKENMQKVEKENRNVWLKSFELTELGRWFALLLSDEKSLSSSEKTEIIHRLFKSYTKWIRELYETLELDTESLKNLLVEEINKIFEEVITD